VILRRASLRPVQKLPTARSVRSRHG